MMQNHRNFCKSEYGKLERVILCEPHYMTIREIINETQKTFKDEGINIDRAVEQHNQFIRILRDHGAEVILLPYHEKFPEQVFTRDIGFTLGRTVFISKMGSAIRKGEVGIVKQWLDDEEMSYFNLSEEKIEGGDVLIDEDTIYIGLSARTDHQAVEHLQSILTTYNVISIPFNEKYLHLDCVFNVVSPEVALIYPPALDRKEIELFSSRYELIEVTKDEQFTLGTNVLAIGNRTIISLPINKNVNEQLRSKGFDVIEVDISEIIKSGGSFRCCTMPILRE